MPAPTLGSLKRKLIALYNQVNQQAFDVGVRQQRIDILGDQIVIVAEHRRVPALASLDDTHRWLTRMVDAALLDVYKTRLKEGVEALVGQKVRVVLKDYDPQTQMAATVILLEAPLALSDEPPGRDSAPPGPRRR